MSGEDLPRALDEFARSREPTEADIARLLREVRRARQRPPLTASLFAYGGWVVAVVALLLVVVRGRAPAAVIASDPTRRVTPEVAPAPRLEAPPTPVVAPAASSPRPDARPQPAPARHATPTRAPARAVVAPGASAAGATRPGESEAVPRLAFEQSRLLARGHLHRVESVLEVVREVGIGSTLPAESRCLAEQHRRLLAILEAARGEMQAFERAGEANDWPATDLQLERLVAQRQAADAVYHDVKLCLGAP